jgi:hypothetical protein
MLYPLKKAKKTEINVKTKIVVNIRPIRSFLWIVIRKKAYLSLQVKIRPIMATASKEPAKHGLH